MNQIIKITFIMSIIINAIFAVNRANAVVRNVNFCNKSNMAVEIAFGYEPASTSTTRTEGWRTVQVCQCRNLFNEDVRAIEFYVYVTKKGGAIGDVLHAGRAPLCVRGRGFRFGTSNSDPTSCARSGGQWVKFEQAIAQEKNHNVNFGSGAHCMD
jgi:uncharacterized membrane protein